MTFKDFMTNVLLVTASPALIFTTYKVGKTLDAIRDTCPDIRVALGDAHQLGQGLLPSVVHLQTITEKLAEGCKNINVPLSKLKDEGGLEEVLLQVLRALDEAKKSQ